MDSFASNAFQPLPVIMQTEMSECGLACMTMILNYYGHRIDLDTLRRKQGANARGLSFTGLMRLADKVHLQSRALRVELDDLSRLKLPCILHWNMNHVVVLKSVRGDRIEIHDPATGHQWINAQELSESFTGAVLELSPAITFTKADEQQPLTLMDFVSNARGFGHNLFTVFVISLVIQGLLVTVPFYYQLVVDKVVVSNEYQLLVSLSLGFLGLFTFKAIASFVRTLALLYLTNSLAFHIAGSLYDHLLKLPGQFFLNRHIGDMVSRFNSVHEIKRFLSSEVVTAIIDGLMGIFTLFVMCFYSVKIALAAVLSVFVYFLIRVFSYRKIRDKQQQVLITGARESSIFMESIRAIKPLKIASKLEERATLWKSRYIEVTNAGFESSRLSARMTLASDLIIGVDTVVILSLGSVLVMSGELSVGMLFAFFFYKDSFSKSVMSLSDKYLDYKMLALHLQRLADFTAQLPEPLAEKVSYQTLPYNQVMQVKSLSYRYSDDEPYIINDLNLTVYRGESIVLTGKSGVGKSTLINLLNGYIQPSSGKILIAISTDDPLGEKAKVAIVSQDDQLLSGSILDNISFFDAQVDRHKATVCAQMAMLHDDICQFPMQYETLIGDMGSTLSGGQKQRLLLARAFYQQPDILFLDEATSHLDAVTEQKVNASIKKLAITRISVAHRMETIQSADTVYRLVNGKLMSTTPEQLSGHEVSECNQVQISRGDSPLSEIANSQ